MEDQGGLVNLILKISFGSTIECVWPKLFGLVVDWLQLVVKRLKISDTSKFGTNSRTGIAFLGSNFSCNL